MLDQYGRTIDYLRISVTDRCNLRCRYCMPEGVELVPMGNILTYEEIREICAAAAALGVRKLKITGGEPLVRLGCAGLIRMLKTTAGIEQVTMTTNGVLLGRYLPELLSAGLDAVNVSLDTLDRARYAAITGRDELDAVLSGVEAALASGLRVKLNAVPQRGVNDDEWFALASLAKDRALDVRFIELMPMGAGDFGREAYLPCTEVLRRLPALEPVKTEGGPAKLYRLPGAQGNVGVISPVSAHFCGSCDRLRLTADGKLKPCLHSDAEYPIKGLDRAGMAEQMKAAILGKPEWHGKLDYVNQSRANRSMNRIGG
jgi:cyclic pyranopterin phosphate synthase